MSSPLFSRIAARNADYFYFFFRVLTGFLFLGHGLQKVGLLEGTFAVQGFMGFIGICEFAGGIALMVGLWTRLVAILGTILLIGAYATVHARQGFLPIVNQGELALLYIAAFAILFAHGAGIGSLERMLFKKESF
ncbi:DoxX family protein [Candidatus Peregrinibacteria bacterium]|nr:DoxX family protein [Candidatus Peregrinibacteria bacterium]MBI2523839.1 DoxX family protein [Candidatus Peregrinibacteria bacterium]